MCASGSDMARRMPYDGGRWASSSFGGLLGLLDNQQARYACMMEHTVYHASWSSQEARWRLRSTQAGVNPSCAYLSCLKYMCMYSSVV